MDKPQPPRSARVGAYLRTLGNPYAAEQVFDPAETSKAAALRSASKAQFRTGCRAILRQYVPPAEKGRLRPAHAAFIARNENRPGTERDALLTALRRYDLSNLGDFDARFNRERDELTEEKLRDIERLAGL